MHNRGSVAHGRLRGRLKGIIKQCGKCATTEMTKDSAHTYTHKHTHTRIPTHTHIKQANKQTNKQANEQTNTHEQMQNDHVHCEVSCPALQADGLFSTLCPSASRLDVFAEVCSRVSLIKPVLTNPTANSLAKRNQGSKPPGCKPCAGT